MIDPEWAEFPQQHKRPGMTQFLLELAPDAPKARIKNDLRGFDPTQLLFLRKLRTVEVSVDGKKMMVRREDFQDVSEYNGEMRRLTVSDPDSHKEVVTDYTIVRKRILVTHESTKRRGAKDTEVVLAFPVASNCPVIQAQNAYNFLPVRKTSFFVSSVIGKLFRFLDLLTPDSFSFRLTSSWPQIVKIWTTRMRNGIKCFSEPWLRPSLCQHFVSRTRRSSSPGSAFYQLMMSRALHFPCFPNSFERIYERLLCL